MRNGIKKRSDRKCGSYNRLKNQMTIQKSSMVTVPWWCTILSKDLACQNKETLRVKDIFGGSKLKKYYQSESFLSAVLDCLTDTLFNTLSYVLNKRVFISAVMHEIYLCSLFQHSKFYLYPEFQLFLILSLVFLHLNVLVIFTLSHLWSGS
jgi:hypothetical protein